jgi:hypothetical protein
MPERVAASLGASTGVSTGVIAPLPSGSSNRDELAEDKALQASLVYARSWESGGSRRLDPPYGSDTCRVGRAFESHRLGRLVV